MGTAGKKKRRSIVLKFAMRRASCVLKLVDSIPSDRVIITFLSQKYSKVEDKVHFMPNIYHLIPYFG